MGEAAMADRGGGEEGRANTKFGEGNVPEEKQQGDQQHDHLQVSKNSRTPTPSSIISLHLLQEQKLKEFPSCTKQIDQHQRTSQKIP